MKFSSCMMTAPVVEEVYDRNSIPLSLSPVGDGGEARVFACVERPGMVAKIYHPDLVSNDRKHQAVADRLSALAAKGRLAKMAGLAWPEEPVYDKSGRLVGYLMKRIPDGYVSFALLFGGVKAVQRHFPKWTRRDLAQTALNFVNLVGILERAGVTPSDWNPANFLVNERHDLYFIDCDSYQCVDVSGRVHVSGTFFEVMAAPELLNGTARKGSPRTPEQTRWSVAVMVYRLLMCGMHPFQFTDTAMDGTMAGSVVDNLKAGKCPLGWGAGCRFSPVWAPLWSWLTGKQKDLFVTTFRHEDDHGWGEPSRRAPLDVQAFELKRFLFEMTRAPERSMLCPPVMKAREYMQDRPLFAAYRPAVPAPVRHQNPAFRAYNH